VLFADLDNFKYVNDSLGHGAGDELLVAVAGRLRAALRPGDTVARLGGDEFAVLLENVSGAGEAERVAGRIVGALRGPFAVHGREAFVTSSIGVALARPGRGASPGDLLREADLALYEAKRGGKARHAVFGPGTEAWVVERLGLENGLRRALERGEFAARYQPIVRFRDARQGRPGDTGGWRVVGFEVLLRWRHPERGLLFPSEFLPLAEELGLTVPIGRWLVGEACRRTKEWQERHPSAAPLAVGANLSARQLSDPGLLGDIEGAAREAGLDPEQVTLEVTEDAVVGEAGRPVEALRGLKDAGFLLALDDFGVGHSSLSHLRRLPIGLVKIDRSFVAGLGEDGCEEDEVLLSGIVGIAHGLGLLVCAEGVETKEQLRRVAALGCGLAQGYYFSRPLEAEEASALLARGLAR
jgi:diguanylate cyclase (GGDEF)-like protein